MSLDSADFVVPRPGSAPVARPPVPGPSEAAFTEAFGTLLPPAKYLETVSGKAAYYELLPSSPSLGSDNSSAPDRVLLIHGVQTPALGMLPLARALHASFPCAHFVLVDLWGHGLSDTPVIPHEQALFHQLIDNLLDHLSWPTAHLIGFSFGASLTIGYVGSRSSRVKSYTLVAPAGLIQSANFTAEDLQRLRSDDEIVARKWIIGFLEGGELVVPADWREKVASGEIVAEAVREWQMKNHPGHTASVAAIFRDGAIMDNDAAFVKAVGTGVPSLVVLGELDDLYSEQQVKDLGFGNVSVVLQAGHGVVRQKVPEVAALISGLWKTL